MLPGRFILTALAGVLLYAAVEEAVFGGGWYRRLLDPESLAGRMDLIAQHEAARTSSETPDIAVVGNSMLAEGFSAKVADAEAGGRARFRNLSVPATDPRCWYYLLRAVDPQARRYKAIVFQIEQFSDEDGATPMADMISDIHTVVPLLAPAEALHFALSYHTPRLRFETLRGALLKGYIYKQDVQAFLESPLQRLKKVEQFRQGYAGWIYDYDGHKESLAGLTVDWERGAISFPPAVPIDVQDRVCRTLLRTRAPLSGLQAAYRRRWFGRILNHYQSSATRLIFVRVPRGPTVNPSFDSPDEPSTIREFASRPNVTVVRPEAFQSLETPECFWDDFHMNALGRERFSRLLVHEVNVQ